MVADLIGIVMQKTKWKEGSAFPVEVYPRVRSTGAEDSGAVIDYRVDCLTTGVVLQDWTSGGTGQVTLTMTRAYNAIQSDSNRFERKQVTVRADAATADQFIESKIYTIENVSGFS